MNFRKISKVPFAIAGILGLVLFIAGGLSGASDLCFALGSGCLIIGLIRLLSNLKMFASASWGFRFFKRLFRNEARSGREETEDYARYREGLGGHEDAKVLLVLAGILLALSALIALLR